MGFRRATWLLAHAYAMGARRFDVFDANSGFIQSHYLDAEGNLEFQSNELISAIDRISARLAAMDLRPKVDRQGLSLGGIRERAVGQLIADAVVPEDHLDRVKNQFTTIFTWLGSCGIAGNVIDHPVVGLTCDLEVVHPRELFPFPSLTQDYTKQRGIVRQRIVPVSFLQEVFGRRIKDNLKKMIWWEQQPGMPMTRYGESSVNTVGRGIVFNQGMGSSTTAPGGAGGGAAMGKGEDVMGVANITETWLDGQRGTCSRYIVCCGDYLIVDEDYSTTEVYCPIGFSRFIDNQTFHGLGAFDLLYGIHRELERLLKSLFNNIRDTDRYGYLVMPAGTWNERASLKEIGRGLRVVPYEQDVVGDNFKPFMVQPWNSGDMPGRVAQLARELMDGMNPIRDLIEEKGRVDSAAGLQFLDEQITRAMTNQSRGVEQAFGTCYRSVVSAASRELKLSPRPLPLSKISLDLAGVVIDPKNATISFPDNPLPSVSNLSFTIKERSPRSEVARKAEALDMFMRENETGGLVDPDSFRIFALKEGLDFAMWMDEYQEPYETAIWNCLILYGDGETPGQVVVTPSTSKPEFQSRIIKGFMSGPRMALASVAVQKEFIKYDQFLMDAMGLTLPAAIPNPDDMALLSPMGGAMGGGQPMLPPSQGSPQPF